MAKKFKLEANTLIDVYPFETHRLDKSLPQHYALAIVSCEIERPDIYDDLTRSFRMAFGEFKAIAEKQGCSRIISEGQIQVFENQGYCEFDTADKKLQFPY